MSDREQTLPSALDQLHRIAIIGTGLIGASVAAALKRRGFAGHIAGNARSRETLDKAKQLGLIDSAHQDAAVAVEDADLVLLAVPMMSVPGVLEQIKPALKDSCILTDGGSVKGCFITDVREIIGDLTRVVPAHPIAGKEHSGVTAADAALFNGHTVILTPAQETEPDAVATVTSLWTSCGALVETLDWQFHDRVLAATSHMPHVVAFTVVDMLSRHQACEDVFKYSAGGFRDFTRIASGDPVMWRDICLSNKGEINEILEQLIGQLTHVNKLVASGDAEQLESLFANARSTRNELIAKYDKALNAQEEARSD